MSESGGYLQEQDLIEECTKRAHYILFHHTAYADEGVAIVNAILGILRQRGLLNDIGIEQVKRAQKNARS